MSDIDVLPLYISVEEGLILPNDGRFTCHDGFVPDLLSGSKSEWNRMLRVFIGAWDMHEGFLSDMFLLRTIQSRYGEETAVVNEANDVVSRGFYSKSMGVVDCSRYSKKVKAIHFSHSSYSRAFLGGWIEDYFRGMHKDDLDLQVRREDGSFIGKNSEQTSYDLEDDNIDSDWDKFWIEINKEKVGTLSAISHYRRAQLAKNFVRAVLQKC